MLPHMNLVIQRNWDAVKTVVDWLTASGIEIKKIDLARHKPVIEVSDDASNHLREHEKAVCYGREQGRNRYQLMVGCVRVEWLAGVA
jgi:hypothetical protein